MIFSKIATDEIRANSFLRIYFVLFSVLLNFVTIVGKKKFIVFFYIYKIVLSLTKSIVTLTS